MENLNERAQEIFGSEENKKARIREMLELTHNEVQIIDAIPNFTMRKILLLALIDSYSQEWGGYTLESKRKSGKLFKEFLVEFSDEGTRNLLEKIDPVTSAYALGKEQVVKQYVSEYPMVVNVLPNSGWASAGITMFREHMKSSINSQLAAKYRYVDVIYLLRNKLVHEMFDPSVISTRDEETIDYLFYQSTIVVADLETKEDKSVVGLCIPYKFLRELTVSTITNYIEKCGLEGKDPTQNLQDKLEDNGYNPWLFALRLD